MSEYILCSVCHLQYAIGYLNYPARNVSEPICADCFQSKLAAGEIVPLEKKVAA